MKYAVVIEWAAGNYSAYVPDLPGCVSTGRTLEEAEQNIRQTMVFHLKGLRDDGESAPHPTTHVAELEIA